MDRVIVNSGELLLLPGLMTTGLHWSNLSRYTFRKYAGSEDLITLPYIYRDSAPTDI
jgi:hypothetical protein